MIILIALFSFPAFAQEGGTLSDANSTLNMTTSIELISNYAFTSSKYSNAVWEMGNVVLSGEQLLNMNDKVGDLIRNGYYVSVRTNTNDLVKVGLYHTNLELIENGFVLDSITLTLKGEESNLPPAGYLNPEAPFWIFDESKFDPKYIQKSLRALSYKFYIYFSEADLSNKSSGTYKAKIYMVIAAS